MCFLGQGQYGTLINYN